MIAEGSTEAEDRIRETYLSQSITDFGNYNRLPEPNRAIAAEEFSDRLLSYDLRLVAVEHRQVGEGYKFRHVTIFWFSDETGVGVMKGEWMKAPGFGGCYGPNEYLEFGCQHELVEHPGKFMFDHMYICPKCGYERSVDSSG